jgi:single-strand DNA-binding protein
MAGSLNKVFLVGRLGQDPKLSYTTSGRPVANFNLATDESFTDKQSGQKVERTEWHRIVVWDRQAEFCSNYLSKGRLVLIEGRLQTRKWQDKEGGDRYTTEIVAQRVQFLDSKPQGEAGQRPAKPAEAKGQQPPPPEEDLGPAFPSEASAMDDVPF